MLPRRHRQAPVTGHEQATPQRGAVYHMPSLSLKLAVFLGDDFVADC
ncbi:MAG: hypothetical protein RL095_3847 [Verrucomicrobiota bacterium]|jgi:hypothetical protein